MTNSNNASSRRNGHVRHDLSEDEELRRTEKFSKMTNSLVEMVLMMVFGATNMDTSVSENSLFARYQHHGRILVPLSSFMNPLLCGYFFSPEKKYGHLQWFHDNSATTGMYYVGNKGAMQLTPQKNKQDGVPLYRLLRGFQRPYDWNNDIDGLWDPFGAIKSRGVVPAIVQLNEHPLSKHYHVQFYTSWIPGYQGACGLFFRVIN